MPRTRRPDTDTPLIDDTTVAQLAAAMAPVAFDPLRQDALLSRILSTAGLEPPLVQTIRVDEGEWRALGPGVEMKILVYDPASRIASFLARYAPGGEVGEHYHLQTEECLLVSGDLTIADVVMQPGDFQIIRPGARHGTLRSARGALVFVRGHLSKPLEGYPLVSGI